MPAKFSLNVNGKAATVNVANRQLPLLRARRNDPGLRGPRGGQSGGGTVHIVGRAVHSIRMRIAITGGRRGAYAGMTGRIDAAVYSPRPGRLQINL